MPAAVPLTAAMTGFSQSSTAAMRRWAPSRIMRATSPAVRSGAPSGRAGRRTAGPQVGPGAEALAVGRQHHAAHRQVVAGGGQQVDDPVALVGRDGVVGLGPVEGDPGHAVGDAVQDLVLEWSFRCLVAHGSPGVVSCVGRASVRHLYLTPRQLTLTRWESHPVAPSGSGGAWSLVWVSPGAVGGPHLQRVGRPGWRPTRAATGARCCPTAPGRGWPPATVRRRPAPRPS